MELEELKHIWQTEKSAFPLKNEAQLASMLRGSSKSLVEKLKKSVWFELIFTIVASVGFLTYAFMLPAGAIKLVTISILVLFVLYTVYYIKKILLLKRFSPADDNLKINLEKLVTGLSGYLKFYKGSYTVLYPVYVGLGILFGAMETGADTFFEHAKDVSWILLLLGVAIAFFFLSMMFANWYFQKLYGNHLDKLKALLKDLQAEEQETA